MIKNIIFDMGNVLIEFAPDDIIGRFVTDEKEAKIIKEGIFETEDWINWDAGKLTAEQVLENAKKRIPEEYHDDAEEIFDNWHYCMPIFAEMTELCQRLQQKGYKLYLLSNANKRFHVFKRDIHALKYFEGTFISADHRCRKPEPEMYQQFFAEFELDPQECVFIDDLPENIAAAEKFGVKCHLFNRDLPALLDFFESCGIK